jgi:hypothetical protein
MLPPRAGGAAPADAARPASEQTGGAGLPAGAQQRPSWPARAAGLVRRHWLIAALLVAGLVLRVLAQVAYQPPLIYVDTLKYLYGASPGSEPLSYTAVLRVVLHAGGLSLAAALQHLLGLAMGLALYVVLLRRGARRWLAAVAAAPVLLDAYQLQMEQTIMPDVWFEALIVAGLAVPLWRRSLSLRLVVAAGLILGVSATFKQLGEVLALPAVVYLLVAEDRWRARLTKAVALCLAFLLPILAYCTWSYARHGHFRLAHGQLTTGRLVASADCATLKLPPTVRLLCPTPHQQSFGPDWIEHSGHSPLYATPLPPDAKRFKLIAQLNSAVVSQQPLRVAASIASDWVRLFDVTRSPTSWVTPIRRFQFQTYYPTYPPWVTLAPGNVIVVGVQKVAFGRFVHSPLKPAYGGAAHVNQPLASFLRGYQLHGGYTPGPLFALLAIAGFAGSVLALPRRRTAAGDRVLALASLLFTISAAVLLMVPDLYEFSWRYQLPALVTLPPAGVLGLSALLSYHRSRRDAAAPPTAAPVPGGPGTGAPAA